MITGIKPFSPTIKSKTLTYISLIRSYVVPVIDVHTHMLSQDYLQLLSQQGGEKYQIKATKSGQKSILMKISKQKKENLSQLTKILVVLTNVKESQHVRNDFRNAYLKSI